MKEFVQRKPPLLHLVAVPQKRGDVVDFTQHTLEQSFAGWLRALEASKSGLKAATTKPVSGPLKALHVESSLELCQPMAMAGVETMQTQILITTPRKVTPKALTTQDYVNVMLATVRESFRHVRWPREVIAKFLVTKAEKVKEEN